METAKNPGGLFSEKNNMQHSSPVLQLLFVEIPDSVGGESVCTLAGNRGSYRRFAPEGSRNTLRAGHITYLDLDVDLWADVWYCVFMGAECIRKPPISGTGSRIRLELVMGNG